MTHLCVYNKNSDELIKKYRLSDGEFIVGSSKDKCNIVIKDE